MLNFLLSSGGKKAGYKNIYVCNSESSAFSRGVRLRTWKPNKGFFFSNDNILQNLIDHALLKYPLPKVINLLY